jgi:hypothetical protein
MNETLTRLQQRAQLFLDNNLKAFIIDKSTNSYHFCHIKSFNDVILTVVDFKGNKAGVPQDILFMDIDDIKLYKEKI